MRILTKDEFKIEQEIFLQKILEGAIFIYPTDTIYGLGCNALNKNAVKKIRYLKGADTNPFSVIAPSKEWIVENCEADKKYLDLLPGRITLVLKLKNKKAVASNVNMNKGDLGVRIPEYWISEIARTLKIPIVTTSVNRIHEMYMTSLEDLDNEIKKNVDFIIYEGKIKGKPSQVIRVSKGKEEKLRK